MGEVLIKNGSQRLGMTNLYFPQGFLYYLHFSSNVRSSSTRCNGSFTVEQKVTQKYVSLMVIYYRRFTYGGGNKEIFTLTTILLKHTNNILVKNANFTKG